MGGRAEEEVSARELTLARRSGFVRSLGVMLLIMLSKVLNCFSASFSCFSDIWFIPAYRSFPYHLVLHKSIELPSSSRNP